MLYYLFRYLGTFGISGAHMWSYISFRAILTLVLSLVISAWFGEWFIKYMKRHNLSEEQRDAITDPYGVEKKGVPTMGGVIIIVSTLIPVLLFGRLRNIYLLLMVGTTIWLGLLGFWDDYTKMTKGKDGIRPLFKLAGQALLGLVIGLVLWQSPDAVVHENVTTARQNGVEVVAHTSEPVKSTVTTIPFVKNNNLRYSDLFQWLGKRRTAAGWILFVFVTIFIVMAVSNGANMNDGMDGMCAGNAAIICFALGILAYVSSHINLAAYLNIMFVPGSEELVVFLAIGGIIAVTAIIIHKELLLPLLCFIFFIESVSVLLQTNYARYGNKRGLKLRFFKRAPLHDTFRVKPGQLPADFRVLLNWPKGCWLESKITTRFWIITIMMCALAIVTLKIR